MKLLTIATLVAGLAAASTFLYEPADAAFPGRNGAIAFETYLSSRPAGYFAVSLGSDGRRRLARGGQNPVYSPDGASVAFEAERESHGFDITQIEMVRSNGRGRRRLTHRDDFGPQWSPDGKRIVFERAHPCAKYYNAEAQCPPAIKRSRNYGIVIYHRGRTRVLTHNGYNPAWSPTGMIAFVRKFGRRPGLYVIRPDGKGARRISRRTSSESGELDWSPNGQRIVFALSKGDRSTIATMRRDGTDFRRIAKSSSLIPAPAYSPDGRLIVFRRQSSRCDEGQATIWVMRPNGSHKQPLHYRSGRQVCGDSPRWQPLR